MARRSAEYPSLMMEKLQIFHRRITIRHSYSGLLAGSVGWGDACIIVPYEMYRRYGDAKDFNPKNYRDDEEMVCISRRASKKASK